MNLGQNWARLFPCNLKPYPSCVILWNSYPSLIVPVLAYLVFLEGHKLYTGTWHYRVTIQHVASHIERLDSYYLLHMAPNEPNCVMPCFLVGKQLLFSTETLMQSVFNNNLINKNRYQHSNFKSDNEIQSEVNISL